MLSQREMAIGFCQWVRERLCRCSFGGGQAGGFEELNEIRSLRMLTGVWRVGRRGDGGSWNPHAGQVAKLRTVLLSAVSETYMKEVVCKLVEIA